MITLHSNNEKRSNAILVKIVEATYIVVTDFGNLRRLSFKELEQEYTPGYFKSFADWIADRDASMNNALQQLGYTTKK